MATLSIPAEKILPIDGEALIVQMREIPNVPNEVIVHITRNGNREERFTRTELAIVLEKTRNMLQVQGARVTARESAQRGAK